jgi:Protein of unknown function (DUF2510)
MSVQAGWYEDPSKQHALRYWDGMRWTEHVHGAAPAAPPASPYAVPPVATLSRQDYAGAYGYGAGQPATASGNEVLKFIGLIVLWLGVLFAIGIVVGVVMGVGEVAQTQEELDQRSEDASVVAQLVGIVAALVAGAYITPKVGYRSRDTFMLLVPILGLVMAVKWLWRLACLNRHYWVATRPY